MKQLVTNLNRTAGKIEKSLRVNALLCDVSADVFNAKRQTTIGRIQIVLAIFFAFLKKLSRSREAACIRTHPSPYKDPDMEIAMPESVARRWGYLVKRTQHALRVRMDEALRPLALTAPQYAVLSAVEAEQGISNARLARAAFVTPQTMQAILANLEREQLLTRDADPDHGRILRNALTRRGFKVLAEAHRLVARVERIMIESVGAEDAKKLTTLLARCADHLALKNETR